MSLSLVIPVVGDPNSTEDPKISSNFQAISTWAENVVTEFNGRTGVVTPESGDYTTAMIAGVLADAGGTSRKVQVGSISGLADNFTSQAVTANHSLGVVPIFGGLWNTNSTATHLQQSFSATTTTATWEIVFVTWGAGTAGTAVTVQNPGTAEIDFMYVLIG